MEQSKNNNNSSIGSEQVSKEQLILQAAEAEFVSKGYAGARTTSIAQAAGVTHAMLHYYFRTKELLFKRILQDKLTLMAQSFAGQFGSAGQSYEDRLRQGISSHFDFLAAHPELPRFIINEVLNNPERMNDIRSTISSIAVPIMRNLQVSLDEAAERGEIVRIEVRDLMLDILSMNVFLFLAMPIASHVFQVEDMNAFLERRKEENIQLILKRIQLK